jgi:hypothetical protein
MRMLVTVEFADDGVKTGTHRVLVVGGCSDMAAPGDMGMSLEEAQTLLGALQCEFVAAALQAVRVRMRIARIPPPRICLSPIGGMGLPHTLRQSVGRGPSNC